MSFQVFVMSSSGDVVVRSSVSGVNRSVVLEMKSCRKSEKAAGLTLAMRFMCLIR